MVKLCVSVISVSILFGWKIMAGFGNTDGQLNFVFKEEKGSVAASRGFFNFIFWPFVEWNRIKNILIAVHLGFKIIFFSFVKNAY